MQGCTADAILSLRTNVAILVNVTSNAHIYLNSTVFFLKKSHKKIAAKATSIYKKNAPNGGNQIRINPYLNSPCKSLIYYHIFFEFQ